MAPHEPKDPDSIRESNKPKPQDVQKPAEKEVKQKEPEKPATPKKEDADEEKFWRH